LFYRDRDSDLLGNPDVSVKACNAPVGYVENQHDCDDSNFDIKDGSLFYQDNDGDGFGDLENLLKACDMPTGYA